MGKSLADQLLGAGLVDEKKVKKIKQEKRKQKKQKVKKGTVQVSEAELRIQAQRESAAQRDRELNEQRKAEEEAKARKAQAVQMLEQQKLALGGDIQFNFADPRSNKVKNILVTAEMQKHLANGHLAICAQDDKYAVVPRAVADKVAERFAEAVVFIAEPEVDQVSDDDPYKDYQIPDDLMW